MPSARSSGVGRSNGGTRIHALRCQRQPWGRNRPCRRLASHLCDGPPAETRATSSIGSPVVAVSYHPSRLDHQCVPGRGVPFGKAEPDESIALSQCQHRKITRGRTGNSKTPYQRRQLRDDT
jgi:hypothetical protein